MRPASAFGSSTGSSSSSSKLRDQEQHVPRTLPDVMRVFLAHPSAAVPTAAICGLCALRLQQPLTAADPLVAAAVVLLWLVQEWAAHKYLLHSDMDWLGKTIHRQHHETPYFHISLDPPGLILSVMAAAALLFGLLFQWGPLSLTATAAYYSAGLLYEWLHYVVHTHWVPPQGWLRSVRRHHMLHHCRNEDYWLSFTAPAVDAWFGTLPSSASSVPLTAMARKGHSATASGSSSSSSSSRAGLASVAAAGDARDVREEAVAVTAGAAAAPR
uniref:Fatty acid hydroxylase domain-containing protein n=1 Tax=Tetradesmus obliquus TaxID=3088 RepID=A0A383WJJ5_TETOB|eukprot:jgi/Sobl393_1/9790/SZX77294.1